MKALGDPAFNAPIAAAEADLRRRAAGNAEIGDPWADIAKAVTAYRELYLPFRFVNPSGDSLPSKSLVSGSSAPRYSRALDRDHSS